MFQSLTNFLSLTELHGDDVFVSDKMAVILRDGSML
jgi:hypothetical protein